MNSPTGWKRKYLIIFFVILFLFLVTQTPAMALAPKIVDVTTKAFSVVWTTGGPYTSCGINLYTSGTYGTLRTDINPSQIVIETEANNPGEHGRQYGIAKVTVVGLNIGATYYFKVKQNGTVINPGQSVTLESLRGLGSTDPNDTDIVSNDIVHKAVYQDSGVPAIGALVLADIYAPGANVSSDPPLSDHPISAWVGDGMIGDEESPVYNPNNISYKQYAAINMNNLFGTDHFPLSLHGDDPATLNVNESEIIKFTIVHGTLPVLGGTTDYFTSIGLIDSVEKANNEKITTAKVSASFKFNSGNNPFAFPFIVSSGYTTGDLIRAIDATAPGVQGGITDSVFIFLEGKWRKTSKNRSGEIVDPFPFQAGQGCFIVLKQNMTEEVKFSGKPNSVSLDLKNNTANMVSVPQLPNFYNTGNFLNDIEFLGGSGEFTVDRIFAFINGKWLTTSKNPRSGAIAGALTMTNTNFYVVLFKSGASNVESWVPFQ